MKKGYRSCNGYISGFSLLVAVAALGGCAAPPVVHDPEPAPENLRMVMMPGVDGSEKRVTFRADGDGEKTTDRLDEQPPKMTKNEADAEEKAAIAFPDDPFEVSGSTGDVLPSQDTQAKVDTDIPSQLAEPEPTAPYVDYQSEVSLQLGFRRDSLNFSIAGPGGAPNIISELEWSGLNSAALAAEIRWSDDSKIYARGRAQLAGIREGEVQDSDYWGNDRTDEFSRSYSDAGFGSLFDMSGGIGFRLSTSPYQAAAFHLMPIVGYSYHGQELEMKRGFQALSEFGFGMPIGAFEDLDSRYGTQWRGPWVGLDSEFVLNERHKLLASIEYHWADFSADADWNLRSDFQHPKSFEHVADGSGIVASLAWHFRTSPTLVWNIGITWQDWSTDPGVMTFFFADGTEFDTRLNEVEWESFSINVGVGYSF